KLGLFLIIFSLLSGGLWYMLYPRYYYVKITSDGTKNSSIVLNGGEKVYTYSYSLKGYDENGNEKKLNFSTSADLNRPFKKNAYLKIRYTNWKQENGYEEIKQSDVPKKALNEIEKNLQ
ncbi:YxeA family protein, partial [Enterococcus faecalis]|nr:hypothetical protein [Enterococcus faecalis]EIV0113080.1 YxeA family protein [Enterococcus faecalis]